MDVFGYDLVKCQKMVKLPESPDPGFCDMKTDVVIDEEALIQSFMNKHSQLVHEMLQRNNFRLEPASEIKKTLYATELPTILYIEFAIDIPCTDLSDKERTEAVLHLKGTGSYDVQSGKYEDIRIAGQEFDFLLADGIIRQSANTIIGAMSIVLGHRDVVHSVRYCRFSRSMASVISC